MRNFLALPLFVAAFLLIACGSSPTANSSDTNAARNGSNANLSNRIQHPDNANLPEGIETNGLEPPKNAEPGLPSPGANAGAVTKRATKERDAEPGTLAPGIPDEETLRKQMKPLDTKQGNTSAGQANTSKRSGTSPANTLHH